MHHVTLIRNGSSGARHRGAAPAAVEEPLVGPERAGTSWDVLKVLRVRSSSFWIAYTLRDMAQLVDWASEIAALKLADSLPRRWRHVQGVAAKARSIAHVAPSSDQDLLVAAAWLHDIGYAPEMTDTGFHPLDGARWLRGQGRPVRLAALVAYHSCAFFEAAERGLAEQLRSEFEQEHSITADLLCYADMTTGPDGEPLTVDARLAEIRTRYGPDDVVTRFWEKAEPTLYEAVARVEPALQPM